MACKGIRETVGGGQVGSGRVNTGYIVWRGEERAREREKKLAEVERVLFLGEKRVSLAKRAWAWQRRRVSRKGPTSAFTHTLRHVATHLERENKDDRGSTGREN